MSRRSGSAALPGGDWRSCRNLGRLLRSREEEVDIQAPPPPAAFGFPPPSFAPPSLQWTSPLPGLSASWEALWSEGGAVVS